MDIRLKPIIALASGALFLSNLSTPSAQAQATFFESGTSTLANVLDQAGGSESLTVSWFVAGNTDNLYTYGFNLNNPAGDVELSGAPNPGAPETVSTFSLSFDATVAGAFVSGTQPIGGTFVDNGVNGLTWTFPTIGPNSVSSLMAFQSDLPPASIGQASAAGGAIPPSPWSTFPAGTPVPVPHVIPEPKITSMFAIAAILLLPFSPTWRRFLQKSWDSSN